MNYLKYALQVVPKDPFLEPMAFVKALSVFHSKTHPPTSHSHLIPPPSPTMPSGSNGSSSTASPTPPTPSSGIGSGNVVFLSPELIETIESHYEKSRQSESYKVHRVLKNKLDDLATDLRTHVTESGGATNATTLSVTSDLAAIARCAVTSKDAPQSLRYFWTGRPGHAEKKRREKEALWSDGERERDDKDKDKNGEKDVLGKEGKEKEERDRERDREARSCDEGDRPWGGRVHRKIGGWAGCVIPPFEGSVIAVQYSRGTSNRLGKGKKLSVDFATLGKAFLPESPRGASEKSGQSSQVPSVVVSRFVVFMANRHIESV